MAWRYGSGTRQEEGGVLIWRSAECREEVRMPWRENKIVWWERGQVSTNNHE
jgi:hypothetical protein